jgi:succinyl-CoA synthetase beta subunit
VSDAVTRGPLVLFSTEGGMEIEEVTASRPEALRRAAVDILDGFGPGEAKALLAGLDLGDAAPALAAFLADLYALWRRLDASCWR